VILFDSLRPAFSVTVREIRDQLRDWRVIFPILGLTLFFPFLMNFTAQQMMGFIEQYGATIIGERLVPFLLMIVGFFPISVSLVIALDTFVGEKERGSIEPLLNTPLLDWQLYLGKLLAATVSPLCTSYIGMIVYLIGLKIKNIAIPEFGLLLQIIVLTTIQATMMVAGAVVVSSLATSVRAANLLASFIIIPAALLIQGESVVMFWGNYNSLWWVVFGIAVLTLLLVRVGLAHFRREELLGREIDVLNVRWLWRQFRAGFTRGARNLYEWYGTLFRGTLREMRLSILLVTLITAAGAILGYFQVERYMIPLNQTMLQDLNGRLKEMIVDWSLWNFSPVISIFWQNLRTLLLSMLLGIFSMGILGNLPIIFSVGIAGYLLGLLQANGVPAMGYLAFIAPHGIIEIPAAVLATAAIFRAGAILATPASDRTIGEAWLAAVADWCRVMIGLVIPMLLLAACVEVWVTPRLALWFFK
jgi:uncharacterized membrane protein SpoIIM required for sporulation/ABC-type transport system involved in multi-copper enzyme maturation permease subunit